MLDIAPKSIAKKSVPPREKYALVAYGILKKTEPIIKPCAAKLKSMIAVTKVSAGQARQEI